MFLLWNMFRLLKSLCSHHLPLIFTCLCSLLTLVNLFNFAIVDLRDTVLIFLWWNLVRLLYLFVLVLYLSAVIFLLPLCSLLSALILFTLGHSIIWRPWSGTGHSMMKLNLVSESPCACTCICSTSTTSASLVQSDWIHMATDLMEYDFLINLDKIAESHCAPQSTCYYPTFHVHAFLTEVSLFKLRFIVLTGTDLVQDVFLMKCDQVSISSLWHMHPSLSLCPSLLPSCSQLV